MSKHKISWTQKTWNPTTGCDKVSAGCRECYAETMFKRLASMPKLKEYYGRKFTDVQFHPERLSDPVHWKKPVMIFVDSMSDLFHESIMFEDIKSVFKVMKDTNRHTFQVLTKRPERMKEYFEEYEQEAIPDNVWLGISAENQEQYDRRGAILKFIPAKVKFLSLEPLLGDILLDNGDGLMPETWDWIIIGAESGAKKRYCEYWNIASIVDEAAGYVPVFVKQIHSLKYHQTGKFKVIKNLNGFPESLRIREFPKGARK